MQAAQTAQDASGHLKLPTAAPWQWLFSIDPTSQALWGCGTNQLELSGLQPAKIVASTLLLRLRKTASYRSMQVG